MESTATLADISELRFLIVEDHGFQRWMLGNTLQSLGAKYVFAAGDGREALDILRTLEPPVDIIVSDLDMPGMDGMEFIRHVGETRLDVSMIVCSGLDRMLISSVESMTRAYGVNLIGAIEKPLTAKKLAGAIAAHGMKRAPRAREPVRLTLAEIEDGLEQGQFEPFFQPQVEMHTRQVRGAEATARWRHPTKGMVLPEAFIDEMERNGLIDRLTDSLLARAAAACRAWRDDGFEANVSVNLSLRSVQDVALADRLMGLVHAHGLEPRHLVIEITESADVENLGTALENLSRLRMKGFGLSIDDYGMGYSSMQQLARFPFTELKIDQGFVRNAASDASSRAMLESSLEMAQKLRITAVAEGVENQAQWDLLKELGCHLAQGFFIARPMTAADFLEWLRQRRNAT